MNMFEHELRVLFGDNAAFEDTKFIGRACYAKISESVNLKLEFVTLGYADRYEGIKATMFNRNDGVIDSLTLRFEDLLGRKQVNNPNFRDGIIPYIWKDGLDVGWYVYRPNEADYNKIAKAVNDYAGLFSGPVMEQEQSEKEPAQGMRI